MFYSLLRFSWGSDRGVTLSALPVQAVMYPHCQQCLLLLRLWDKLLILFFFVVTEKVTLQEKKCLQSFCVSVYRKATNTCKLISTLKLICKETCYCVAPQFAYDSTQCTTEMEKATNTSRTAKHPNSYGKKTGCQMDFKKAPLVKTPVNMDCICLY